MKPEIKYGLIGGIVFVLVSVTETYFLDISVRNHTVCVYLRELVLGISVIAAIKSTRDANPSEPLELKTGLRSGVITTLVVCLFYGIFSFVHLKLTTEDRFNSDNEMVYSVILQQEANKDTSTVYVNKQLATYDSAMKVNDLMRASFSARRARLARPNNPAIDERIKKVDHLVYEKTQETGFALKNIFMSGVFFQLIMGMLISFVTIMIFRAKQQSEQ
ncbi:MAG TPA: DUF4199 domain-containing protein [Bacteroidia bacterium]|jgi:hypothetical protein